MTRLGHFLFWWERVIHSHGTVCRLRATRDDFATLRLQNLLGFEHANFVDMVSNL